jgi:hypothetical protein
VRARGGATAHSDAGGRFRLPPASAGRRLTAWKEGYFIAGGSAGDGPVLRLRPLPTQDDPAYAWVDPTPLPADESRCGNCHPGVYREWAGSGHARSANGKRFGQLYAGLDGHGRRAGWGLLTEHPDGAGVCSSCHAPTVRDDDPALFDLRRVGGVAARGVHCDYCHKVSGLNDGPIGLAHGRFLHTLLRPGEGQLFFGPLDDVDRGDDAYSPFYRDSRYCAACHEGVVFGVPVYTTYSEWLDSPARRRGQHCQACHMKPTGRTTNIAPGHGGRERPSSTLANHVFWDGSQEQMLRRSLRLLARPARRPHGVEVRITLEARGVGHRVPTGFIDRQVILVVEATTPRGVNLKPTQGPTLPPAVGRPLAGKAGKLYARLLKDQRGKGPVPFWRAHSPPDDTRLRPERPDEVRFTFPAEAARVHVRVLHRRFWEETARGKGWADRDLLVVGRTLPVP